MEATYRKFGLYTIDVDYLRYLHSIDDEVNFSEDKDYSRKPFIGIIVQLNALSYFIPLSSPKEKHREWKNVERDRYLVYEKIDSGTQQVDDIIKPADTASEVLRILSALDIRKMIPVPGNLFKRIDINAEPDQRYKCLLLKEYLFCQDIQDDVLLKAKSVYNNQKETGKIFKYYCNFAELEKAASEYSTD